MFPSNKSKICLNFIKYLYCHIQQYAKIISCPWIGFTRERNLSKLYFAFTYHCHGSSRIFKELNHILHHHGHRFFLFKIWPNNVFPNIVCNSLLCIFNTYLLHWEVFSGIFLELAENWSIRYSCKILISIVKSYNIMTDDPILIFTYNKTNNSFDCIQIN